MSKYKPPVLDGQKVSFKGKRFWLIEVDEAHPFEEITADLGDYAIYDKFDECVIGTASRRPQGRFRCTYWYGQISLTCDVQGIENVGRVVSTAIDKLAKYCS